MADSTRDPLAHPLYRVAHLHGDRWVTLQPADQHSALDHGGGDEFAGGTVYECPTCQEKVIVAPEADAA